MALPLYRLDEKEKHERRNLIQQARGNSGLIFNKFFDLWKVDRRGKEWNIESGDKANWIQAFSRRPAGNRILQLEAIERLVNLTEFLSGKFRCYKTAWRFITGLGLNNPLENGMIWHQTLGVPYIPGTSVKGLVRAWVEQWADHLPQNKIDRIFGSKDTHENEEENDGGTKTDASVGSIIFFDALSLGPIRLKADVMTPHYQKYYSGDEAPGDWLDPNPIPFLTVDKKQVFLFAIAPREKTGTENQLDLEIVLQWLEEALANIGAGAKTATGYGRFVRCVQAENKLEAARQQQKEEEAKQVSSIPPHLAGPIADEMLKEQCDADPDNFLPVLKTKWITKMQADETPATDQQTIAKLLKNWFQTHRKKHWKKPSKKNAPAVEAIREMLGEKES